MSNTNARNRPVTVREVVELVSEFKPMSRETVYQNMRKLHIEPIGARQSPQLYPPDTATRILQRYGFK